MTVKKEIRICLPLPVNHDRAWRKILSLRGILSRVRKTAVKRWSDNQCEIRQERRSQVSRSYVLE